MNPPDDKDDAPAKNIEQEIPMRSEQKQQKKILEKIFNLKTITERFETLRTTTIPSESLTAATVNKATN